MHHGRDDTTVTQAEILAAVSAKEAAALLSNWHPPEAHEQHNGFTDGFTLGAVGGAAAAAWANRGHVANVVNYGESFAAAGANFYNAVDDIVRNTLRGEAGAVVNTLWNLPEQIIHPRGGFDNAHYESGGLARTWANTIAAPDRAYVASYRMPLRPGDVVGTLGPRWDLSGIHGINAQSVMRRIPVANWFADLPFLGRILRNLDAVTGALALDTGVYQATQRLPTIRYGQAVARTGIRGFLTDFFGTLISPTYSREARAVRVAANTVDPPMPFEEPRLALPEPLPTDPFVPEPLPDPFVPSPPVEPPPVPRGRVDASPPPLEPPPLEPPPVPRGKVDASPPPLEPPPPESMLDEITEANNGGEGVDVAEENLSQRAKAQQADGPAQPVDHFEIEDTAGAPSGQLREEPPPRTHFDEVTVEPPIGSRGAPPRNGSIATKPPRVRGKIASTATGIVKGFIPTIAGGLTETAVDKFGPAWTHDTAEKKDAANAAGTTTAALALLSGPEAVGWGLGIMAGGAAGRGAEDLARKSGETETDAKVINTMTDYGTMGLTMAGTMVAGGAMIGGPAGAAAASVPAALVVASSSLFGLGAGLAQKVTGDQAEQKRREAWTKSREEQAKAVAEAREFGRRWRQRQEYKKRGLDFRGSRMGYKLGEGLYRMPDGTIVHRD